jgi:ferric-dicitrate binding protein FerR (iron transport regulator)
VEKIMANNDSYEAAWEQAISWIMRQHENPLNEIDLDAMSKWLKEDPLHQKVYGEVRALWIATGLIPLADEL